MSSAEKAALLVAVVAVIIVLALCQLAGYGWSTA